MSPSQTLSGNPRFATRIARFCVPANRGPLYAKRLAGYHPPLIPYEGGQGFVGGSYVTATPNLFIAANRDPWIALHRLAAAIEGK